MRANVNPFLVDKLYQSQFYAKLDGKKLQVENFTYDSNTKTYHFVVDVYRVDSDDYEYKMSVYIRPDGFSEQKSDAHIDIQFMVPFELDMENQIWIQLGDEFVKESTGYYINSFENKINHVSRSSMSGAETSIKKLSEGGTLAKLGSD